MLGLYCLFSKQPASGLRLQRRFIQKFNAIWDVTQVIAFFPSSVSSLHLCSNAFDWITVQIRGCINTKWGRKKCSRNHRHCLGGSLMYFTHEYKLLALWDGFGLKGAWNRFVGCLIKTLHRHFTSHPFSLDVCALQKRCLYSQLPRLNSFYCTNTVWHPQFVHTLNALKDISPGSGTARSIFYTSILALTRLVRKHLVLRADPRV